MSHRVREFWPHHPSPHCFLAPSEHTEGTFFLDARGWQKRAKNLLYCSGGQIAVEACWSWISNRALPCHCLPHLPATLTNESTAMAEHHHGIYNWAGKVETADRKPHGGAVKTQAAAFLHHFTLWYVNVLTGMHSPSAVTVYGETLIAPRHRREGGVATGLTGVSLNVPCRKTLCYR